ncbi:MAG: hypothetical protein U1F15_12210 [Burkholderiales bacterium]
MEEGRDRLLDPVDRISEILFGLIMAVTIVGTLSIGSAGKQEMHTVTLAALGCNIAWGLVDAVMYLVRRLTERSRNRNLARHIAAADPETARRLIAQALPENVNALVGPDEIDGMHRRLLQLDLARKPLMVPRDYLEAVGIFVLVVLATFPIVAPFILVAEPALAMRLSHAIALVMLLAGGVALGRYAGHPRPLRTGLTMALLGAALIAAVKALGG